jgi:hypothetical protein
MITFNSIDIITDTEGVIEDFKRGTMNRKKEFYENARGDGEGVKYLNKPGASHSVSFVFMNVALASVSGIETRVLQFADYQQMGTLSIPSKGFSAANCVVESVDYVSNDFRIGNLAADLSFDEVRELKFEMVFRQLK